MIHELHNHNDGVFKSLQKKKKHYRLSSSAQRVILQNVMLLLDRCTRVRETTNEVRSDRMKKKKTLVTLLLIFYCLWTTIRPAKTTPRIKIEKMAS